MEKKQAVAKVSFARFYLPIFLMLFVAKLMAFLLVAFQGLDLFGLLNLGAAGDGNYYDAYARGEVEAVTSLWPILLRALNDWGLYDRKGVALALFLLGAAGVPWLVGKLVRGGASTRRVGAQSAWFAAMLVSLYPTLFFYTLDLYRDAFMLFLFLTALVAFQTAILSASPLRKTIWLATYLLIGAVLYLIRGYLGFSVLTAWPLASLLGRIRLSTTNVVLLAVSYLTAVYLGHHLGLFAPLYAYRSLEVFEEGGSSFRLGFHHTSGLQFMGTFLLSFLFQIFGLYLTSWKALVLFLVETVPFMAMISSIWKRRLLLDGFSRYLIIFSLIYATIFVLGNDNLGTAARLRMFIYVGILIVWVRVLRQQREGHLRQSRGLL